MSKKEINSRDLKIFRSHLINEEKSAATVEKYLRDARAFIRYAKGKILSKELTVAYKRSLENTGYKPRSINSMLASLNRFLDLIGAADCKVKSVRIQREAYESEDKELSRAEYERLLSAAKGQEQLGLIIRTICATGIRVSELRFFTVEAVRRGEATVKCKGKSRTILIPNELKRLLLQYLKRKKRGSGEIFVTKSGKSLDRSYIWAKMKSLCSAANVSPSKVFPHNLRKLFARTFYSIEKDIAKLADILGHSSIETTRIYIMTTGLEHRKRIEKMDLVFSNQYL